MNAYENGIEKMRRASLAVCLDYPLYGSILLRMDNGVVPDETCDTVYTDGRCVGFNPTFAAQLTHYGCLFVIIHEVWHIMMKHHLRKGKRIHDKWNRAADYVIHCNMKADGFRILSWVLFDMKFDNMHTEKVYSLLDDDGANDKTHGGSDTGTIDGQEPTGGNGQPIPGSGVGDVRQMQNADGSEMSESEKAAEGREIDVAISQGINQQKACGKGTGGADRIVKDLLDSKVSWETELRQYLECHARDDYNFAMPNRRFIAHGLYMPTLKSEAMPDMAFIIDTSGSVSDYELHQFMSEIYEILSIFEVNIHVIYVDSQFKGAQEFNSKEIYDLSKFNPQGGGGTDFRPGFEWLEKQGIEPAVCVYLTDLDCNRFPKAAPDYDVIWACTDPYYANSTVPFGKVIEVELENGLNW